MSGTQIQIAVTGVTGAVGGMVASELAAAGVPLRLLARDPSRAPALPAAEVMPCSYEDSPQSGAALAGIRTVFMVSGQETVDRVDRHRAFIDAAVRAGVEHIVYTSFIGAAPDATFTLARDHHATEEHIRTTGLRHTFLRDCFYLDFLPALVGEDGVIRGPAGTGTVAAVARADVAAAAAAVLRDPAAHLDVTYELTGRESLGMTEVAQTVGSASGLNVKYHDETVSEAYGSRERWNAPPWQNDAWVSTYTAIARGEMSRVTGDVEFLPGRQPITLKELLSRS